MIKKQLTAAALIVLSLAGAPTDGMAQGCMSRQDGQQLVARGEVIPFPVAMQRAGLSRDQLVGSPNLCRAGGGYVYRVRVLQRGGRVRPMSIPAG